MYGRTGEVSWLGVFGLPRLPGLTASGGCAESLALTVAGAAPACSKDRDFARLAGPDFPVPMRPEA